MTMNEARNINDRVDVVIDHFLKREFKRGWELWLEHVQKQFNRGRPVQQKASLGIKIWAFFILIMSISLLASVMIGCFLIECITESEELYRELIAVPRIMKQLGYICGAGIRALRGIIH